MKERLFLLENQGTMNMSDVHSQSYIQNIYKKSDSADQISDAKFMSDNIKYILEKSYRDGYARGQKDGYGAGQELIQNEMMDDRLVLQQLAQSFSQAMSKKSERVAQDLLSLALDISKAMIKIQIKTHPEMILPIIKDAIRLIPSIKLPIQILLNPDDARIVHMHADTDDLEWIIIEDPAISQGGCKISTLANEVDVTNESRWKKLSEALGQNNEWLMNHDSI